MTANELADAVEGAGDNSFNDQAARMLRKQDKKIKDLLEHNVNLIDDLFAARKEVIKIESEIEALKAQLEKERNIYAYALYKKASEKCIKK